MSRERFTITTNDIGRYVRRISTGALGRVVRDPGNGWVHPGVVYEWRGYVDDLEYVVVMPATKQAMRVETFYEDWCAAQHWYRKHEAAIHAAGIEPPPDFMVPF